MKRKTVGRYHSKREIVTVTPVDYGGDLFAMLKDVLPPSTTRGRLDALVDAWSERAAAYLRARGLPDVPRLVHDGRFPGKWQSASDAAPVTLKPGCGFSDVDVYVRQCKFAVDSGEELAARVLTLARDLLANLDGDPAIACMAAFKLGEVIERARAYGEMDQQRMKKRASRRKLWADALARKLNWEDIPDSDEVDDEPMFVDANGEGWRVYLDGDKVVAVSDRDQHEESLKRSSFERYYRVAAPIVRD